LFLPFGDKLLLEIGVSRDFIAHELLLILLCLICELKLMKWLAVMSYEECFVGGECYNFWENLILNDESKVFISEISII